MSIATERPLTARQMEVLTLIYETARDKGYQPSFREIGNHLGVSGITAQVCHLKALREKGWIEMIPRRERAVTFLLKPNGEPFTGFADRTPLGDDDRFLTKKQAALFRFVYETARDRGYQPSFEDIMEEFGFRSRNAANCHLKVLKAKKMIVVPEKRAVRSIVFLRRPDGLIFSGFSDKPASEIINADAAKA